MDLSTQQLRGTNNTPSSKYRNDEMDFSMTDLKRARDNRVYEQMDSSLFI